MSLAVLSASDLSNKDILNTEDEKIGQITEIMIDVKHGRVTYAVLYFDDSMGFGDKLFAIPWQALTIDSAKGKFRLNVKKEMLEKADRFDKDNLPDMTDVEWNYNTYLFYGFEPYW